MTHTSKNVVYVLYLLLQTSFVILRNVVYIPPQPPVVFPLQPQNASLIFTFEHPLAQGRRTIAVNSSGETLFEIKEKLRTYIGFYTFDLSIQPKNGKEVTVHANSDLTWCHFTQTYKMSDGNQLLIEPRQSKTDRWRIKKTQASSDEYTWYRERHSMSGPVKTKNGTQVAHFNETATWVDEPGKSTYWFGSYKINSTGEVPAVTLLALYETAVIRRVFCGL